MRFCSKKKREKPENMAKKTVFDSNVFLKILSKTPSNSERTKLLFLAISSKAEPIVEKTTIFGNFDDPLIMISVFLDSFCFHIAAKRSKNNVFEKNASLVPSNENKIHFSLF